MKRFFTDPAQPAEPNDRQLALHLLWASYEAGTPLHPNGEPLEPSEFNRRAEEASRSTYYADLAELLQDLPAVQEQLGQLHRIGRLSHGARLPVRPGAALHVRGVGTGVGVGPGHYDDEVGVSLDHQPPAYVAGLRYAYVDDGRSAVLTVFQTGDAQPWQPKLRWRDIGPSTNFHRGLQLTVPPGTHVNTAGTQTAVARVGGSVEAEMYVPRNPEGVVSEYAYVVISEATDVVLRLADMGRAEVRGLTGRLDAQLDGAILEGRGLQLSSARISVLGGSVQLDGSIAELDAEVVGEDFLDGQVHVFGTIGKVLRYERVGYGRVSLDHHSLEPTSMGSRLPRPRVTFPTPPLSPGGRSLLHPFRRHDGAPRPREVRAPLPVASSLRGGTRSH